MLATRRNYQWILLFFFVFFAQNFFCWFYKDKTPLEGTLREIVQRASAHQPPLLPLSVQLREGEERSTRPMLSCCSRSRQDLGTRPGHERKRKKLKKRRMIQIPHKKNIEEELTTSSPACCWSVNTRRHAHIDTQIVSQQYKIGSQSWRKKCNFQASSTRKCPNKKNGAHEVKKKQQPNSSRWHTQMHHDEFLIFFFFPRKNKTR